MAEGPPEERSDLHCYSMNSVKELTTRIMFNGALAHTALQKPG